MVAVKFWACSKQSHKGRRGGRSLTGRWKEAGWRHTHRRGRRMDAQWSAIDRPVKKVNIVYQFERHVCLPCTTIVPPLADQWRPLSDHCGDHCASIQRPRQHSSHHDNGSAFTLPSLRDLLCHYSSFGCSRNAQGSCYSSYTETELSGSRRPLSVLTIFIVAQRSQPCVKGALRGDVHFEWFNHYWCTGEHFKSDLDIFQFDFMLVKPHDVPPLLCFNVRT